MRRRVGLAYCGSDPTGSGDLAHDVSRLKGVDSQWLRSGGQGGESARRLGAAHGIKSRADKTIGFDTK
jgi:hypothetical protein